MEGRLKKGKKAVWIIKKEGEKEKNKKGRKEMNEKE